MMSASNMENNHATFVDDDDDVECIERDDDDDDEGNDATMTDSERIDRRDEVGEVRKLSSKDTNRLRRWRIVVTGVLLLTAFAVTFTTYTLLKQQEEENFRTAVCWPIAVPDFARFPAVPFSRKSNHSTSVFFYLFV
jgi:hypothetical protein